MEKRKATRFWMKWKQPLLPSLESSSFVGILSYEDIYAPFFLNQCTFCHQELANWRKITWWICFVTLREQQYQYWDSGSKIERTGSYENLSWVILVCLQGELRKTPGNLNCFWTFRRGKVELGILVFIQRLKQLRCCRRQVSNWLIKYQHS